MIETLRHIDHQVFHFINTEMQNGVLDVLCPLLREKLLWIPLYLWIAYSFYKRYGAKTLWLMAIAGLTIFACDQISATVIKPIFHRLRPCNNPEINARLLLDHCGSGYSFVSAHAANHFGLATFLSFFVVKKKLWIPVLYLWAGSVALSQVYVGVHFPGDIFGGALLGIAIGITTALIARKIVSRN